MTETEERLFALCETVAAALDNSSRLSIEIIEILQSALGLREGLRSPDETSEPTHFLDGAPVKR